MRIIKKALDLGVNNIDTANIYTGGQSEELIGKAIRGNREDLVIATKAGLTLDEAKPNSTGLLWSTDSAAEGEPKEAPNGRRPTSSISTGSTRRRGWRRR